MTERHEVRLQAADRPAYLRTMSDWRLVLPAALWAVGAAGYIAYIIATLGWPFSPHIFLVVETSSGGYSLSTWQAAAVLVGFVLLPSAMLLGLALGVRHLLRRRG